MSHPTPERIFRLIHAFRGSCALQGALELGLFTALGGESKGAAQLAEEIDASERGTRILCDFLCVEGLIEKQDGLYRSAADAALFLDRNSPAYVGSVGQFMLTGTIFGSFADIAGVVRKGGTLMEGQGTVEPNHPVWVDFARSMAPLMQPAASFIAELVAKDWPEDRPMRVLDIAAGHGVFGLEIAGKVPSAHITAVDWPAVLEVASENAENRGLVDRFDTRAGDAFETDFGTDYDVVLLTNFLHHFDPQTCTTLLSKVHGALGPNGRAITLEFVPNDDRITPADEATFALVMLATTRSGDAYTFAELEKMASEASFARSELHRADAMPQSVVVSYV